MKILLIICLFIIGINAKVSYRGFKLVRIHPNTDQDVQLIEHFEQTDSQVIS